MATTIITKNGSGAPLAGDLTAGELAVDLTNKRLYSKDSGGTVIELGTNAGSSTFTDLTVSGDLTVDTNTLYVDSTNNRVGIGTTDPQEPLSVESSGQRKILATNTDFASGTTGTSFDIGFGATSGNTYTDLRALINGRSAWGDLVLQRGGGNVGIGASDPSTNNGTLVIGGVDTTNNNPQGSIAFTDGGDSGQTRIRSYRGVNYQTGELAFEVAQGTVNSYVEAMRIDGSGNVGIGTDDPSSPNGFSKNLTISGSSCSLALDETDANTWEMIVSSGSFRIYDEADERMRIDASGNVGIGTSAPTYAKTVIQQNAVGESLLLALDNFQSGVGNEAVLSMGRSNTSNRRVKIRAIGTGNNFVNPALAFDVNESERMRINSSGNLLVGNTLGPLGLISTTTTEGFGIDAGETYVAISRSNIGSALYLNKPGQSTSNSGDFIQCRQNGTVVGEIDYDGADLVITQASDERLKNNIADSASAGSIIDAMQVRSFDWNNGVHVDYGFVAQELHQAYEPAAKVGGDDIDEEPWGIKTQKLIPLLVKEIQDLRARVAQLEGAN